MVTFGFHLEKKVVMYAIFWGKTFSGNMCPCKACAKFHVPPPTSSTTLSKNYLILVDGRFTSPPSLSTLVKLIVITLRILLTHFCRPPAPLRHCCIVVHINVPQKLNIFFNGVNRPSDDSSRRIIPVQVWELLHTFKYFF